MSFATLKASLVKRLDEGDRGDRAWWLLTRVHLSASRLQAIARYLYDSGASKPLALTSNHYKALGDLLEITNANPRQTINRHYFLAMETPLRLLAKTNPNSWDQIVLTPMGVQLATSSDSVAVFEDILSGIRFCKEPWFSAGRVEQYSAFDIYPYDAVLKVIKANAGYLDVDEFDLFVSRIRTAVEIKWATDSVAEFRGFNETQKAELRKLVEDRIPAGNGNDPRKPYNNWRDMARHTFSLFSLGQSAYREGNELLLSKMLVAKAIVPAVAPKSTSPSSSPASAATPASGTPATSISPSVVPATRSKTLLRIPEIVAPEDLLTPPLITQSNTGTEAELLIGKILAADGWQVVYYNQRRGYGFDLWAKKHKAAVVLEVKSFLGAASSVTFTALELEAAKHHKNNFLLVIVENAASDTPLIHVVQDPASTVKFVEKNMAQFVTSRSEWETKASKLLPS